MEYYSTHTVTMKNKCWNVTFSNNSVNPCDLHISERQLYFRLPIPTLSLQEASKVYFLMSKKYSTVLDVWVKAGIHFFKHKRPEEARRYMERALLSLDKRDRK